MFRIEVLQTQWLMLSLLGGAVLVLAMVLSLLAIWRPRQEEGQAPAEPAEPSVGRWLLSFMPWALVLVYVGTIFYVVLYAVIYTLHPPNW